DEEINCYINYNNKLLGCSGLGIHNVKKNEFLLNKEELEYYNLSRIKNLVEYDGLYALVTHQRESPMIYRINDNGKEYYFEDKIFTYENNRMNFNDRDFIILPREIQIGLEKYPFTMISCANLRYLDIFNTRIKDSDESEQINTLNVINHDDNIATIVYGGMDNKLIKAKIDIDKRCVLEKEKIVSNYFSWNINSLSIVKFRSLHEKIIDSFEIYEDDRLR
ncbi:hypothetical protein ACFL1H_01645, partial [Nanoarchaeota archaeon]